MLETQTLCDTRQQQFSNTLQFIDANSPEGEYLFSERNGSIIFSLPLCLNSKKLEISFSSIERQFFQRIETLIDIASSEVSRNDRGTEICEVFLLYIVQIEKEVQMMTVQSD